MVENDSDYLSICMYVYLLYSFLMQIGSEGQSPNETSSANLTVSLRYEHQEFKSRQEGKHHICSL